MKNVILIHGLNGVPKIFEWLKTELESINIKVTMPNFPPLEGVIYENWKEILDQYKTEIDSNTIIVCHSIGNEFAIKYFTENNLPIDTYIGLAGFAEVFYIEEKDILNKIVEKFLVTDQEKQPFISLCKKRYAIYSDNDHVIPFDILENYPKEINATPIMIPGIGHMGKKSGLEKIPKLLELVKENLA